MKEWLKHLWDKYWSDKRLATAGVVFISSLTVVEILIWRLDIPMPISSDYFYAPTAIGALTGYYLTKDSRSKVLMSVCAVTSVVALTAHRYCAFVFTEITFGKVVSLVLLAFVGVGALFAVLRILLNQGLE